MSEILDRIFKDINLLWTCFISAIGVIFANAIGFVIWQVSLQGKVKKNEEVFYNYKTENEKLFQMFCEHSKERDVKLDKSIDDLFSITRRIENAVSTIEGKMNREGKKGN